MAVMALIIHRSFFTHVMPKNTSLMNHALPVVCCVYPIPPIGGHGPWDHKCNNLKNKAKIAKNCCE